MTSVPVVAPLLDDDLLLALLSRHAPLRPVPLAPGVRAFCADDELPLWVALEEACGQRVDAPFFAVPWPGAQAVARALQDRIVDVTGRVVLEVGCGSGVAATAAALAGARRVIATDVDPLALQVTRLLARAHDVVVETVRLDVLDAAAVAVALDALEPGDVVVGADVVYNRDLGGGLTSLIAEARRRGLTVLVADSGRPFFEAGALRAIATFVVPVPVAVEGQGERRVTLYR